MDVFKILRDRVQGKAPKGARRSSHWRRVRKNHLKLHPKCAVCELSKAVEVHHIVPFHIAPDMELNPHNLMTLCENHKYGITCHILVGHLGNYSRINPNVEMDAMIWHKKIKGDDDESS